MKIVKDTPTLSEAGNVMKEDNLIVVVVWYLCRACGLSPLTIQKTKTRTGGLVWLASFSPQWSWYSWVVPPIVIVGSYGGAQQLIAQIASFASNLGVSFYLELWSHCIALSLTAFIGVASCKTHVKNLVKARLLTEECHNALLWANLPMTKDRRYNVVLSSLLAVTFSLLIADIYNHSKNSIAMKNLTPAIVFIFNHCVYIVTCAVMIRVTNTIYPLKAYFILVRQATINMNNRMHNVNKGGDTVMLAPKISSLTDARLLVSKAALILGEDQSVSNFMSIFLITVRFVLFLTHLIKDKLSIMQASIFLMYLGCEAIKLICLIETCYQVSEESNKWISCGAEMLKNVTNTDLRNDLKFCMVMAIDQPLTFTACGIFTMNRELLATMCGLIITTVLILFQVT